MAPEIKLSAFEGPLDLLLHLIDKNKIDIFNIPIVQITDQYMEYIHAMDNEDLELMSEFLVMAATLLDIKCRMLLPAEVNEEGEEEDPREELVQKLLEYKMYKSLSYDLKDRMDMASGLFFKEQQLPGEVLMYREPVDPQELLTGMTLKKLNEIFQSVLRRQENKVDPIRSRFGKIEKEEISLSDKLTEIQGYAKKNRRFSFRGLLHAQGSRTQLVVTFLSILELMKMGHVQANQDTLFGDITVEVMDDPDTWKDFTEFADE